MAFIVDGYVVDRTVDGEDATRWTTMDFVAEDAEWGGEDALVILGGAGGEEAGPRSVYRAASGEESLAVDKVATDILAVSPGTEEREIFVAQKLRRGESGIALLRGGRMDRVYTGAVEGTVTGLSPSPDGRRLALAVRPPGDDLAAELHVFDLQEGKDQRVSELDRGRGIIGAPQWTDRGIYFVAGAESDAGGDREPLYDLYRSTPEPGDPEPAPGVGSDFIAGSARVSPDGGRLAVVGRLNPSSPINLYVLDLDTKDFGAVTTNEDMEIKTGPDDLAWSPAGTSVSIVARVATSGKPEVLAAPAGTLLDDFYNLYEVPILDPAPPGGSR